MICIIGVKDFDMDVRYGGFPLAQWWQKFIDLDLES
jgi:hypothetical protein